MSKYKKTKRCIGCKREFIGHQYYEQRFCEICRMRREKRLNKKIISKKSKKKKTCKICGINETQSPYSCYCQDCYRENKSKNEKKYYLISKKNQANRIKILKKEPFLGIKFRLMSKVSQNKIYHNNKNHQVAVRLRNLLRQTLNNYSKTGKIASSRKYGIDYQKIINHLKPFPEDISKYHIDHIKPLCSFDFNDKKQIKKAFAPENHQWLLAEENLRKIKEDIKQSIH